MEPSTRNIAIVVAILLFILSIYIFVSKPSAPITSKDVRQFILSDLKGFSDEGAKISIISLGEANNTWKAKVKISFDPHSACPRVIIRNYELKPSISMSLPYRESELFKNCSSGGYIFHEYPEMAIVASENSPDVRAFAESGAKGYASFFPREKILSFNCSTKNCSQAQAFLFSFPPQNIWLVSWIKGNSTFLVALSEYSDILGTKQLVSRQ